MTPQVDIFQELRCPVLPERLLLNAHILRNRLDILPRLPTGGVFVEIGVAAGDFSYKIQQICRPDLFVAIDLFKIHEAAKLWGKPTADLFSGESHEEFYRRRFCEGIEAGRVRVMTGDSAASLSKLEDSSIDVAYLDADHSYAAVGRDLALLDQKVKRDGWIIINDYTMGTFRGRQFQPYGVIQATHEFMLGRNWEIVYLALHPFMHCDVALRRVQAPTSAD